MEKIYNFLLQNTWKTSIIVNVDDKYLKYFRRKKVKEKVTVLIADDNQEFSKTLSSYLESQPDMEVKP